MRKTLLLAAWLCCLQAMAQYTPAGRPHQIATVDISLHDNARSQDVPLRITLPQEQGVYPVILFSHGAGGSGHGYASILQYWASYGYVILQPTYEDSLELQRNSGAASSGMRGVMQEAHDSAVWVSRIRDAELVLNSLARIEQLAPAVKGKMNAGSIGAGGHSLGTQTSLALAGATLTLVPGAQPKSSADGRIRATLLMSAQGPGQMGFTECSWDKVRVPMMSMTGSRDRGAEMQSPEWRKAAYDHAPGPDKFHVFIEGASHFSFAGDSVGQRRPLARFRAGKEQEIERLINSISLAFWDAYLKGDAAARKVLEPASMKAAGGAVTLYSK